jgi:HSP20 family protein
MVISKFHSETGHSRRAKLMGGKQNEAHWSPNTDVYVTDTGLVIKVELAGMKREDLELSMENSSLKISGLREDGCRTSKCKFLVMEIIYGSFETVIDLPPGYDLSQAKASYQNGFLRVDVPVLAKITNKVTISVTGS